MAITSLVYERSRRAIQDGNRTCLHKSTHAGLIRGGDKCGRAIDVNPFQFVPMAPAFVVVTEEGCGMKYNINPGK
jgi:hypothetical protein